MSVPTLTDLRPSRHAEAVISCRVPSRPQQGHGLSPDDLDDAVTTATPAMDVRYYEDAKARRGDEFFAELRTRVLDKR